MNPFLNLNEQSQGGISKFEFILLSAIQSIPMKSNMILQEGNIVLKSGQNWLTGLSDESQLLLKETPLESDAGQQISKSLYGFLPYDHPSICDGFKRLLFKDIVLKVTDSAGYKRLVGDFNGALRLMPTYTTQVLGGTKGWAYEFKGIHADYSSYLE